MRRFAAAIALATQSSCALFASANAAHSHISGCVDEPMYGVVDVVLGSLGAAALMASGTGEEHPATLAIPAVFLLSGFLGIYFAHSCASEKSATTASPVQQNGATPYDYNYRGVGAEPPVREADPGDEPHEPPKDPLRLDPAYPIEKIACSMEPLVACPPDMHCRIVENYNGYCEPDR